MKQLLTLAAVAILAACGPTDLAQDSQAEVVLTLAAADQDREGYVPNVVYTCGGIRHGDCIFMPYGVADSSIAFAFVPISALLAAM